MTSSSNDADRRKDLYAIRTNLRLVERYMVLLDPVKATPSEWKENWTEIWGCLNSAAEACRRLRDLSTTNHESEEAAKLEEEVCIALSQFERKAGSSGITPPGEELTR